MSCFFWQCAQKDVVLVKNKKSEADFKTDVVDCRYIDFLGPLPIFKVTEESEVSLSSLELRSAILNPFSHTS
jgi:hypothetical protein